MAQKIDILFIHPNASEKIYQGLSGELSALEPPLWAGLLANGLRAKGHSVAILDSEAEGLTVDGTVRRASQYEPRLTALVVYGQQPSASTQNMFAASLICTALKNAFPERKIAMAGGHVSALPARTLQDEKADFVIQGEGLATLHGLLGSDLSSSAALNKIPGLWYREAGRPVFTFRAELICQEDLPKDLPGVAWDLLPMDKYRAHNWHCFGHVNERQPYASIYTSLGCPFQCSFCCINAPFGGSSFRYWEPEFIIREFEILHDRYGVRNLKITDEMFVLKELHFLKLCDLLIERDYGFNIWAYARVDTVKPAYFEKLKKAGVNWLALGIESGSQYVRSGASKGKFDHQDIYDTVKRIQDAGIHVIGNFIFGLTDDTYSTMRKTLDMAMNLNCEMANFYSAMAYPGSKLYQAAVEKKWPLPERWLGYSQYAYECLPIRTETLSGGEVLGFRDQAWRTYFTNPGYLNMIEAKFGKETSDHIRELSMYSLKRKFAVPPPKEIVS